MPLYSPRTTKYLAQIGEYSVSTLASSSDEESSDNPEPLNTEKPPCLRDDDSSFKIVVKPRKSGLYRFRKPRKLSPEPITLSSTQCTTTNTKPFSPKSRSRNGLNYLVSTPFNAAPKLNWEVSKIASESDIDFLKEVEKVEKLKPVIDEELKSDVDVKKQQSDVKPEVQTEQSPDEHSEIKKETIQSSRKKDQTSNNKRNSAKVIKVLSNVTIAKPTKTVTKKNAIVTKKNATVTKKNATHASLSVNEFESSCEEAEKITGKKFLKPKNNKTKPKRALKRLSKSAGVEHEKVNRSKKANKSLTAKDVLRRVTLLEKYMVKKEKSKRAKRQTSFMVTDNSDVLPTKYVEAKNDFNVTKWKEKCSKMPVEQKQEILELVKELLEKDEANKPNQTKNLIKDNLSNDLTQMPASPVAIVSPSKRETTKCEKHVEKSVVQRLTFDSVVETPVVITPPDKFVDTVERVDLVANIETVTKLQSVDEVMSVDNVDRINSLALDCVTSCEESGLERNIIQNKLLRRSVRTRQTMLPVSSATIDPPVAKKKVRTYSKKNWQTESKKVNVNCQPNTVDLLLRDWSSPNVTADGFLSVQSDATNHEQPKIDYKTPLTRFRDKLFVSNTKKSVGGKASTTTPSIQENQTSVDSIPAVNEVMSEELQHEEIEVKPVLLSPVPRKRRQRNVEVKKPIPAPRTKAVFKKPDEVPKITEIVATPKSSIPNSIGLRQSLNSSKSSGKQSSKKTCRSIVYSDDEGEVIPEKTTEEVVLEAEENDGKQKQENSKIIEDVMLQRIEESSMVPLVPDVLNVSEIVQTEEGVPEKKRISRVDKSKGRKSKDRKSKQRKSVVEQIEEHVEEPQAEEEILLDKRASSVFSAQIEEGIFKKPKLRNTLTTKNNKRDSISSMAGNEKVTPTDEEKADEEIPRDKRASSASSVQIEEEIFKKPKLPKTLTTKKNKRDNISSMTGNEDETATVEEKIANWCEDPHYEERMRVSEILGPCRTPSPCGSTSLPDDSTKQSASKVKNKKEKREKKSSKSKSKSKERKGRLSPSSNKDAKAKSKARKTNKKSRPLSMDEELEVLIALQEQQEKICKPVTSRYGRAIVPVNHIPYAERLEVLKDSIYGQAQISDKSAKSSKRNSKSKESRKKAKKVKDNDLSENANQGEEVDAPTVTQTKKKRGRPKQQQKIQEVAEEEVEKPQEIKKTKPTPKSETKKKRGRPKQQQKIQEVAEEVEKPQEINMSKSVAMDGDSVQAVTQQTDGDEEVCVDFQLDAHGNVSQRPSQVVACEMKNIVLNKVFQKYPARCMRICDTDDYKFDMGGTYCDQDGRATQICFLEILPGKSFSRPQGENMAQWCGIVFQGHGQLLKGNTLDTLNPMLDFVILPGEKFTLVNLMTTESFNILILDHLPRIELSQIHNHMLAEMMTNAEQ